MVVGLATFFWARKEPKTPDPVPVAVVQQSFTLGLSPEQVREVITAVGAGVAPAVGPLADRIEDLGKRLGATDGAVRTMLRIIGQQEVPLERLPEKLAEVAQQYKTATDRVAALDAQTDYART